MQSTPALAATCKQVPHTMSKTEKRMYTFAHSIAQLAIFFEPVSSSEALKQYRTCAEEFPQCLLFFAPIFRPIQCTLSFVLWADVLFHLP